ncbi:MAG: hypothetical protein ACI90V_006438 [Bacillariaceae sp.]|jgi:hypothetical protein
MQILLKRSMLLHALLLVNVLHSLPRWSNSFVPVVVVNNNQHRHSYDGTTTATATTMIRSVIQRPGFILRDASRSSSTSSLDMVSSDSSEKIEKSEIEIPFDGKEDRFDRWKFLQEFLDGDASSDVVNIILYRVLDGALKYPRPTGRSEDNNSISTNNNNGVITEVVVEQEVVEMLIEVKENIKQLLSDYSTEGKIPIVGSSIDDDGNNTTTVLLFERLEKLIPDPIENEDDFKSAWDTLLEIHGRESVKINENQIPKSMEWKIATVVTRLLIHFDFLQIGIVDSPLF